jgi:hypothetical protein
MADVTEQTKDAPEGETSPEAARAFRRDLIRLVLSMIGYAAWFLMTMRLVMALDDRVFPKMFPAGIFRPHAQPQALLLEAMFLLIIGGAALALTSPARRGFALRALPTLIAMTGLTFWLGGGEVSQLDREGLWRTPMRGVADEFVPWSQIKQVRLVPFVWHQRRDGAELEAGLGLRVWVQPEQGEASRLTVTPETNLLELANVLDAQRTKVTAERPSGQAAQVYRFHPRAPQAILLSQYVPAETKPTPLPELKPADPLQYWWLKRRRYGRSH